MKYKVFSIRDSAANVYGMPFFQASTGQGMRLFNDACLAEDSLLGKHPEDFELFLLGEFDDTQAVFECEGPPHSLIRGIDCVKKGS